MQTGEKALQRLRKRFIKRNVGSIGAACQLAFRQGVIQNGAGKDFSFRGLQKRGGIQNPVALKGAAVQCAAEKFRRQGGIRRGTVQQQGKTAFHRSGLCFHPGLKNAYAPPAVRPDAAALQGMQHGSHHPQRRSRRQKGAAVHCDDIAIAVLQRFRRHGSVGKTVFDRLTLKQLQ